MVTDPIADLLTRVRNAQRAGHKSVRVQVSNQSRRVLELLKDEGFISSFEEKPAYEGNFTEYNVVLKYNPMGKPLISLARRVSKPGRRIYSRANELPKVHCGLGIAIISTSQGVLSDREARKRGVGGEVLAHIG